METLVCSYCYAEMQNMPYERSCFGKPITILPDGKKLWGFNPKAWECREICPDSQICASINHQEMLHGDD